MFGWLKPKRQEAEAIPPQLALAIESASVIFRDHGDPEDGPRLMVKVSGLGAFYWQGLIPAAERIERHTGLHPAICRKAAKLLASVVATKNRGDFRQPRQRRSSWVGSVLEW